MVVVRFVVGPSERRQFAVDLIRLGVGSEASILASVASSAPSPASPAAASASRRSDRAASISVDRRVSSPVRRRLCRRSRRGCPGRNRLEPHAVPIRRRFARPQGRCAERAAHSIAPRGHEAPEASTPRTTFRRVLPRLVRCSSHGATHTPGPRAVASLSVQYCEMPPPSHSRGCRPQVIPEKPVRR